MAPVDCVVASFNMIVLPFGVVPAYDAAPESASLSYMIHRLGEHFSVRRVRDIVKAF